MVFLNHQFWKYFLLITHSNESEIMTEETLHEANKLKQDKEYLELYLASLQEDKLQVGVIGKPYRHALDRINEMSTGVHAITNQRPIIKNTLKHMKSILINVIREEIAVINSEIKAL